MRSVGTTANAQVAKPISGKRFMPIFSLAVVIATMVNAIAARPENLAKGAALHLGGQ
jgi:hypothetical protein